MAMTPLSDGGFVNIPDGSSDDQANALVNQAESQLAQKYGDQAAKQNSPVTAGSKVYSATTTYPNTYLGQGMAWADHNLGGNLINPYITAANQATGGWLNTIGGALGRAEAQAVGGPADLAAAVYNTLKHNAVPFRGTSGDLPYASQAMQSEAGIPALPNTANIGQRALEAGASAYLNPYAPISAAKSLMLGTTGTVGSTIGQDVGGETGGLIGSIIGGGWPVGGNMAAKGVAAAAAHPDAPAIYEAAQRLGAQQGNPNFQPSFTSLAGPKGQAAAKWLEAKAIVGAPISNANAATEEMLLNARDRAAQQIAGPGGIPSEGATKATIGQELISGAQQAEQNVNTGQSAAQNAMDFHMYNQPVDVAPVISNTQLQLALNPTIQPWHDAIMNELDTLQKSATIDPNTGAMNVPWSVAKDWRTALFYQLDKPTQRKLDFYAGNMRGQMTNAMRNTAAQQGLAQQFDLNNAAYTASRKDLGTYEDVGQMKEGQAANIIPQNIQSPSALEPYTQNPSFPIANWNRAAGQYISTLGQRGGPKEPFRPEHMAQDWGAIDPQVQSQLTQGPGGAPLQAWQDMNDAAKVGSNVVTPVARHGLTRAISTGTQMEILPAMAGAALEHMASGGGEGHAAIAAALGVPALTYMMARGLESSPVKRAMGGQSTPLAESVFSTIPGIGATANQDQYRRLRASPVLDVYRRQMGQ